ncbi:MAG: prepilin-type N-terminal cleavage/methylation domain-containing protein [Clostridia bacterium]|nr:prepilin-type N-terminal cleavage/methylation domain-containing protein [Clostridia bacterium]
MFRVLTSKKGFTLVELVIVLLLLSLGSVAMMNLFSVAYRSYDKSEERYIKQEAVKEVAALLQTGTTSVAAAKTADIFDTPDVVPAGQQLDDSFSYLFATESTDETTGEFNGYFLYVQNKGMPRGSAIKLSETPIYVEIKPYFETKTKLDAYGNEVLYIQQYNAVTITLSALEDDYDYASGLPPTSDDKYYSIDVAYHFPNMATSNEFAMVNRKTMSEYATASLYQQVDNNATGGKLSTVVQAIHCDANCSYDHCGCYETGKKCEMCDCACPGKRGVVLRVYCDSIISPDNTEASVSVPSMCFIATASYGLDSGEVGALCEFRDECLKTNPLGRAFVKAYYTVSPPIAELISQSEPLKAAVRTALKPLVVVAEYSLNEDIRAQGIASFAIFMLCGAGASAMLLRLNVRMRKRKNK